MKPDKMETSAEQIVRSFGSSVRNLGILSLLVMVMGSYVRAADAGLACPDWPLCFGRAFPSFDFWIFLEWFHRFLAAVLVFFVAWTLFSVWRHKIIVREFGKALVAASCLLFLQVILGGLTVLKLLQPSVVSFHLVNAVLFFSILVWIFVRSRTLVGSVYKKVEFRMPKYALTMLRVLSVGILAQIVVGGMVSTNYAGMVCPELLSCHGELWPVSFGFLEKVHMLHRYMAVGVVLLVGATFFALYGLKLPPITAKAMIWIPFLLLGQILLGIANVIYNLSDWSTVLHLGNAVAIFGLALAATLECFDVTIAFQMVAKDRKSPAQAHGKLAEEIR